MSPAKPYPGFWHAALLCVIFVSTQMAVVTPAGIIDAIFHLSLATHPAVLGCANVAGFAVVLGVARAFNKAPFKEVCPLRRVSPLAVAGVIVASGGSIILLSEVDNLFRFVVPMPEYVARIFESVLFREQYLLATAFLLMIVAPVTEEIMFRGLILRGFLRRFSQIKAFLLSSLLFGAIHLNPWQFLSASLLGILFAWWYARTRSLLPPLLGHFLVNGTVVIAPRLPFEIRGFNKGEFYAAPELQPLWFDGLGLALLLVGLWLFRSGSEPFQTTSEEVPAPAVDLPPIITSAPSSPSDSTEG